MKSEKITGIITILFLDEALLRCFFFFKQGILFGDIIYFSIIEHIPQCSVCDMENKHSTC